MSLLQPCSYCGGRLPGKNSHATWAWFNADGQRVAWRQKLCLQCFVQNVAVLETGVREEPLHCPACHTDPGESMDPTYLTIFIPSVGMVRLEMATCGPCAAEVRIRAQKGAEKLDDSQGSFGGQGIGPQTQAPVSPWAQLGITPRE